MLVDFYTRGVTVSAASYCAILDRLHKAFRRKRLAILSKFVLLFHDSTRPRTASIASDLKQRLQCNILEHPPYSLDLEPSDFHFFGPLNKHLVSRHFRTYAEIQEAIVKWLHDLDTDLFYAVFDRLFTGDTNASTIMVTMWKSSMY
ncbi:hypothetical protein AVEN_117277-1 [Araneus ventricosus]|uniref:Histone-lysine N-methyltransferase SETMAR n=1 Tax=Araneus ventricosus TaxID=182803 RepID=A0A4Y2AZD0_ARAVE|nr:hypothetical protein AVEN_117277-1 [Araneus ventricosus]